MNVLCKIPLESEELFSYIENERNFLKGLLNNLETTNTVKKPPQITETIVELTKKLPPLVERISPSEEPVNQIQSLLIVANILSKVFATVKLADMGLQTEWVSLVDGFIGKLEKEEYEIAILLYLAAAIYQWLAKSTAQTSPRYRYYNINALSCLKGAKEFMNQMTLENDSYAFLFDELLSVRILETQAEITRSEAFIARQKGDFEQASKLYAGVASYRFSMMAYNLPEESDYMVKILASTELGMACFYIAVGLTNSNESEKALQYLLKARSYFENSLKLAENDKEILEAANRRLELVNASIEKLKDSVEVTNESIEEIADPQPLMVHTDPEPILTPDTLTEQIFRICSHCNKKIPWKDRCPKCGEIVIPVE